MTASLTVHQYLALRAAAAEGLRSRADMAQRITPSGLFEADRMVSHFCNAAGWHEEAVREIERLMEAARGQAIIANQAREWMARAEKAEAALREAVMQISTLARSEGEARGALHASEKYHLVEEWRERAEKAEAALAAARNAALEDAAMLALGFAADAQSFGDVPTCPYAAMAKAAREIAAAIQTMKEAGR